MKAMKKVISGEKVKKRKPYVRTVDKNDMAEKLLEREILWELNRYPHIIAWKSGEWANYNSRYVLDGMADIGGFNLKDKYIFFIDLDGHHEDKKVKEAIKVLERKCLFLKILGSYPKAT